VTNIEMLNAVGGHFDRLWKKKHFTDRVISVVWDEGHCVSVWSGFREYKNVERLRYIIPKHIPFYVTSATMPDIVLQDVMNRMKISKDAYFFRQSNDRPNVHISVRELKYPQNSFHDLTFLIPEGCSLTNLPPKFLIFFDSIPESIEAAKYLRSLLPPELQYLIKWFNSDMSPDFRRDESAAMKDGKRAGLCCTDSFGMVSDILV
jgi:superfamily II DNA helicase RecQ